MIPVRLFNGSRELVGIHLEPAEDAPPQHHAVLLCNPFGQEGIRAHRLYRVMSERLAAAGHHVLRFDYYGSGDSAGSDEEWDVQGSIADAQTALAELLRRSHASRWSAVGLRLGGAIALELARLTPSPAQLLMLIEPVLDGNAYLRSLAESSMQALDRAYGVRWPLSARLREAMLPDPESEALGFYLGPQARAQIAAITPDCLATVPASTLRLLAPDSQATRQLLQHAAVAASPAVEFADSDARIDWATDSAAATSIVPLHWIRDLLDHLAVQAHA